MTEYYRGENVNSTMYRISGISKIYLLMDSGFIRWKKSFTRLVYIHWSRKRN